METCYRGAMQGSISRIGSARTAVLLIPILYSAIHFFGGAAPIPYAAVTPGSGFTMLAESLRVFANPQQIADAFLALYVVGVLLALIRYYSGNIAGCIGLHAGIVAEMTVVRRNSSPLPDSQWTFMVSRFDHTLGIWATVVALAACWVVWTIGSRGKASSKAR